MNALDAPTPGDRTHRTSDRPTSDGGPRHTHGRTGPSDRDHDGPPVLDPIETAIAEMAAGRPIVVVDDEDRENEGDLIFAASAATPELVAFMVRYTSGVICVPMTGETLDRLALPPMTARNEDRKGTAYTVSVDARDGVTTGISAADRAHTIRLLADPGAGVRDFTRPGHVFPLRAVPGGVLSRPGHTEATVDLARLAGLPPAGAIAEVVNDDGTMARLPQLYRFAREHGLALVSIADLIAYRRRTERLVTREVTTRLPTRHGVFTAVGYRGAIDGAEHVALVHGDVSGAEDVLVRLHSECLTGDVFGSLRCDCGPQLEASLRAVVREGRGVVVYLRGHEGRGIGLLNKLQAYGLQDEGHDTVDANLRLGLPADARDYGVGAQILADLGVESVRLLTNNPAKRAGLEDHGVKVTAMLPLVLAPTQENLRYLRTKRDRMGHRIPGLDPAQPAATDLVPGMDRPDGLDTLGMLGALPYDDGDLDGADQLPGIPGTGVPTTPDAPRDTAGAAAGPNGASGGRTPRAALGADAPPSGAALSGAAVPGFDPDGTGLAALMPFGLLDSAESSGSVTLPGVPRPADADGPDRTGGRHPRHAECGGSPG